MLKKFNDIQDVWLFLYDGPVPLEQATTDEVAKTAWMTREEICKLFEAKQLPDTLEYSFTEMDEKGSIMENRENICTCKDRECPFNPVNHDKGCTLCIEKNLRWNEIPSCFFNKLGDQTGRTGYGFADFARAVLDEME